LEDLFWFHLSSVRAGEEDLAVLVEAVNQTFDGIGRGRSHRPEDSRGMCGVKSKVKRQKPKVKTADQSRSQTAEEGRR